MTFPPPRQSWISSSRHLLWLLLPLAFYLLPLLVGYSWNALGSNNNVLNPPEGYEGRRPGLPITVEPWGTSVIVAPYHARLKRYLQDHELPLWNPYQGLGQPLAAQGEGCPYSPISIMRAFLPYTASNYVTLLVLLGSAAFLFMFLRNLSLSPEAALFGATTFVLSGAVSLHLPRTNILEQVCLIPVLFWAAEKAVRERRAVSYVLLAMVSGFHALGGFNQIALMATVTAIVFALLYTHFHTSGLWPRLRTQAAILVFFTLGNLLAALNVIAFMEAVLLSSNKNIPSLGFLPIPASNVIAFFFPHAFGPVLCPSRVSGLAEPVDWDNLFGFAGTGILIVAVAGLASRFTDDKRAKYLYLFFLLCGVLLLQRYVSAAPGAVINLLPLVGRQSPKHSNGLTVFCFVVAASFACDQVRAMNPRRLMLVLALVLAYFLTAGLVLGGRGAISRPVDFGKWWHVAPFFAHTALAAITFVVLLLWCSRAQDLSRSTAIGALTLATLGELSMYVPLGQTLLGLFLLRWGCSALLVLAGAMLLLNRRVAATGTCITALSLYALSVSCGTTGLPENFDLAQSPRFAKWLSLRDTANFRTFGIHPEFSSIDGIQDVSAVGPLAPKRFVTFVELVAGERPYASYRSSNHFHLTGNWGLSFERYDRSRPIFDWFGVRYFVLDKDHFHPTNRSDYLGLLHRNGDLRVAYEDDRVRIIESPAAKPRACFCPTFVAGCQEEEVYQELARCPSRINGPPLVECDALYSAFSAPGPEVTVPITTCDPNKVGLHFIAPTTGLVVLKDVCYPGWEARVDGKQVPIYPVNGMVRGVLIEAPGFHAIEFRYAPAGFRIGIWLSTVAAGLLLTYVVAGGWMRLFVRQCVARLWRTGASQQGDAAFVRTPGNRAA